MTVVLLAFGLGVSAAAAAYGVRAQDGRISDGSHVDGTLASITGNGFGAVNNQCVIYAILLPDVTANAQIESGLVRCNNANLDGMCAGGYGFFEAYTPSTGFTCYQGSAFTNGVPYSAIISRKTSPVTQVTGSILNASNHIDGIGTSDVAYAQAWAEATGGANCPNGNPSGEFHGWNRLSTGSGWAVVGNSNVYHGGVSQCWTVHNVGSAGALHVD